MMSPYDRLLEATRPERERFLAIPIVRRAAQSGVSRASYLAFLGQAYHHVSQTCPLLRLTLARCGAGDGDFPRALRHYIEEESGHEGWILDDIAALGGDAPAVAAATPGLPCRALVGYVTYAIEHVSPYAMLGMVHVLEGMSVALAERAARAIAASLGTGTGAGFSYLVSHGALDRAHVRFLRDLVDGVPDAAAERAIVETADVVYRLYGEIFRDLEPAAGTADAA